MALFAPGVTLAPMPVPDNAVAGTVQVAPPSLDMRADTESVAESASATSYRISTSLVPARCEARTLEITGSAALTFHARVASMSRLPVQNAGCIRRT
jgi:hypothetical protein